MHVHHHSSSCTCSLVPPVINVGDPLAATSLLEALSKWGWAPLVDDDAKSKLVNVKATVTQLLATSSLLSSSTVTQKLVAVIVAVALAVRVVVITLPIAVECQKVAVDCIKRNQSNPWK